MVEHDNIMAGLNFILILYGLFYHQMSLLEPDDGTMTYFAQLYLLYPTLETTRVGNIKSKETCQNAYFDACSCFSFK